MAYCVSTPIRCYRTSVIWQLAEKRCDVRWWRAKVTVIALESALRARHSGKMRRG